MAHFCTLDFDSIQFDKAIAVQSFRQVGGPAARANVHGTYFLEEPGRGTHKRDELADHIPQLTCEVNNGCIQGRTCI